MLALTSPAYDPPLAWEVLWRLFKACSGFLGNLAWKRDALVKKVHAYAWSSWHAPSLRLARSPSARCAPVQAIEAHDARRSVDGVFAGLRRKSARISLHTETYKMTTEHDVEGAAYTVKRRPSANTQSYFTSPYLCTYFTSPYLTSTVPGQETAQLQYRKGAARREPR